VPLLIGETDGAVVLQALADARGQVAAGKEHLTDSALILLVTLRLRSTLA
jgi:hypothetical protein